MLEAVFVVPFDRQENTASTGPSAAQQPSHCGGAATLEGQFQLHASTELQI